MAMMLKTKVNGGEMESLAELLPALAEKESLAEVPPVLAEKSLTELPPALAEKELLAEVTPALAVKECLADLPPALVDKESLADLPPALAEKDLLAEVVPALAGKKSLADLPPALLEPESRTKLPPAKKPVGLPPDKYVLVGWDIDTTGRRLIDEIFQIAAYTPKLSYSQYIMPYGDLKPGTRRRHNVMVFTVGPYRMLKNSNTNKIIRTKSVVAALSAFLDRLEKLKGDGKVILIYHEPRRLSPTMLLEALTRYKLLDRFKSIVAGFADSYALAADKCKSSVKSFSLRVLARVLLDEDTLSVANALNRATAAYRIVKHLAQGEQREVCVEGERAAASMNMVEAARAWARPLHTELEALSSLKELLERQNTFRPVFAPLLRLTRAERKRATKLRRLLTDAGLLYNQMRDAWQDTQIAGLEKLLAVLPVSAKKEDIKELIEIFDCHFDPAKEPKGTQRRAPRYRAQAPYSAGWTYGA